MPTMKKGLSPLARAQFGLSGKQIRRSVHEHNAGKTTVDEKVRGAFIAVTATPPQAAEKPEESEPEKK